MQQFLLETNVALAGPSEITALIRAWGNGDQTALGQLAPLVYNEVRRIARRYMRNRRSDNTLQTTALVHEAYLHLMDAKNVPCRDRAHFFAASAQIMRRIMIDAARARTSLKRGGGMERMNHSSAVNLDEIPSPTSARSAELLALDVALSRLEQLDDRKARVVELRFFGGLGVDEVADVLNISPQSVMRDWRLARVWLARELQGQ